MMDPAAWEVYLVTDRAFSRGRTTREIVESAVQGGVSVVQLREKDLTTRAFYEEGLQIRDFLRTHKVPLIINDRIDVALALDAEGVHLGQDDMPAAVARRILGPDRIIGISVNRPEDIGDAVAAEADYVAVSPVFFTATKDDITKPWGLEGVRLARSLTDLPVVAIGSIKLENTRDVAAAGADCVAVVTAIVAADDPAHATQELLREVKAGKAARASSG
jgi:thiamine-phosphate pyrophosphorylase